MKRTFFIAALLIFLASCAPSYVIDSIGGGYPIRTVYLKDKTGNTKYVRVQSVDIKEQEFAVGDKVKIGGKCKIRRVK